MSIEGLLQDSIIADLRRDPTLQQQIIRKHDYGGALAGDDTPTEEEATSVIVVTATDRGEFKMGSGIRTLLVEVKIRVNGAADNFDGTLLDTLKDLVDFRLMPSPTVFGAPGREYIFSTNDLQVKGIMAGDTQRSESGLERTRTIKRTFIAAQLT